MRHTGLTVALGGRLGWQFYYEADWLNRCIIRQAELTEIKLQVQENKDSAWPNEQLEGLVYWVMFMWFFLFYKGIICNNYYSCIFVGGVERSLFPFNVN